MKLRLLSTTAGLILACGTLSAAPPDAKTVPWVANNPLIPHDTWDGKSVTLKGAVVRSNPGNAHSYTWDFGDGSPVVTGAVTNDRVIEATHAYVESPPPGPLLPLPPGTVITAKLTVEDDVTGESETENYLLTMRTKSLSVEVNCAIDEGLWYNHKTQAAGGNWSGPWAASALNTNCFLANGHFEVGSAANPYTETVQRGMSWCLDRLQAVAIAVRPGGDPDTNANGLGIRVPSTQGYSTGIFIDLIVASGTPAKLATTGAANVVGRSYFDIVQDMCDWHGYAQYSGSAGFPAGSTGAARGLPAQPVAGWRYSEFQFPDNSANQWAAIGLKSAEVNFGCSIPTWVKTRCEGFLNLTQRNAPGTPSIHGQYGYTNFNHIGSRFGTTPSGLVFCAFVGIGRGDDLWDLTETLIRDNWDVGGNHATDQLLNWYGLFGFVKAMQNHSPLGVSTPLTLLQSATPGVPAIDYYEAQTAAFGGTDPVNGVARTVVNLQNANGSWPNSQWFGGNNLDTARGILMLNRNILGSGSPVAVAKATPNPAVAGQTINLDGTASFHQDSTKSIVAWEWDLDNDGTFDVTGPFATVSFPVIGNYPVKLRVTDNAAQSKTDDDIVTLLVTTPPVPPTANAGGSYFFCLELDKLFLDGTGSVNPDEGGSEPGQPGDTIQSYEWDLDGDNIFDDATGANPDVKAYFAGVGPGDYLIQLKVTDTTGASYPSSGFGDLSDTDSATVKVVETCDCIDDLRARPKSGKVQLTWTDTGADHYNVYRSETQGGPYAKIGSTTSTYSVYIDNTVTNGTTYYYVVREANALDQDTCQSNEASATPTASRRRR